MVNEMDNQGESYAQIRQDLIEIRSAELTLENYKKWSDKIVNKSCAKI